MARKPEKIFGAATSRLWVLLGMLAIAFLLEVVILPIAVLLTAAVGYRCSLAQIG